MHNLKAGIVREVDHQDCSEDGFVALDRVARSDLGGYPTFACFKLLVQLCYGSEAVHR